MDAVTLFIVLITLTGQYVANESNVAEVVSKSETVNVACGKTLNLYCSFKTKMSCTWKRNNEVIKVDNKRYFANDTWNQQNGITICLFKVTKTEIIDSGNWTCGIPASDSSDTVISEIITVNVQSVTTGKVNSIPLQYKEPTVSTPNVTYIIQSDSVNTYVIIGVLTTVILILALVIITWMRMKKKRTTINPSHPPSFHLYEDIDENAISITSDPLAHHFSFIKTDEPEDVTELAVKNSQTSQVTYDSKLSSQHYMPTSRSYENIRHKI